MRLKPVFAVLAIAAVLAVPARAAPVDDTATLVTARQAMHDPPNFGAPTVESIDAAALRFAIASFAPASIELPASIDIARVLALDSFGPRIERPHRVELRKRHQFTANGSDPPPNLLRR